MKWCPNFGHFSGPNVQNLVTFWSGDHILATIWTLTWSHFGYLDTCPKMCPKCYQNVVTCRKYDQKVSKSLTPVQNVTKKVSKNFNFLVTFWSGDQTLATFWTHFWTCVQILAIFWSHFGHILSKMCLYSLCSIAPLFSNYSPFPCVFRVPRVFFGSTMGVRREREKS